MMAAFCYRITGMTKILLALLTLAIATGASAQPRQYYDRSGQRIGTASTDSSGTVTNYDSRGKVISKESTTGNQTTIYDAGGRNVGRFTFSREPPFSCSGCRI
jgi:YD repeat-containing protein